VCENVTEVTAWGGDPATGGSEMGSKPEGSEGWRDRVMAGADGVVHAASCCAPDAWMTDRREVTHSTSPVVEAEPVSPPSSGSGHVHVVGTTR
jgi:hypothetical protein